ncbi:hypothetical protein [Marinimicrobium sp. ABcell2]|uniref:hypothetical protein n=1 Tax=Marinimicrobium sp. ABcell2 TaxID=3069751 RepID=UPI0027AE1CEA|nr:hypothetical protein [Marinimicrobium sp. ABcell2]MDQ2078354.1 hypothetical protein [Marinimicrobium sp. ABcell2]
MKIRRHYRAMEDEGANLDGVGVTIKLVGDLIKSWAIVRKWADMPLSEQKNSPYNSGAYFSVSVFVFGALDFRYSRAINSLTGFRRILDAVEASGAA